MLDETLEKLLEQSKKAQKETNLFCDDRCSSSNNPCYKCPLSVVAGFDRRFCINTLIRSNVDAIETYFSLKRIEKFKKEVIGD